MSCYIYMGLEMKMNILLSVNNAYVQQLIVLCNSLFINNKNSSFHIYLLHSELTNQNQTMIADFMHRNKASITIIKVNGELFRQAPEREGISMETYYRLLAFEILGKDLKRILYLDVDMIVTGSIRTLYNWNIKNKMFAAVPDQGTMNRTRNHGERLGMVRGEKYVNAGVLLINLDEMRRKTTLDEIFTYIQDKKKSLRFQDQDVINGLFHDEIIYLPARYNKAALYTGFKDLITYPIRWILGLDRPKGIIHYMGPQLKPWRCQGYGNKYFYTYYQYCNVKECKELRIQIESNKRNRIKSYIKEFTY